MGVWPRWPGAAICASGARRRTWARRRPCRPPGVSPRAPMAFAAVQGGARAWGTPPIPLRQRLASAPPWGTPPMPLRAASLGGARRRCSEAQSSNSIASERTTYWVQTALNLPTPYEANGDTITSSVGVWQDAQTHETRMHNHHAQPQQIYTYACVQPSMLKTHDPRIQDQVTQL